MLGVLCLICRACIDTPGLISPGNPISASNKIERVIIISTIGLHSRGSDPIQGLAYRKVLFALCSYIAWGAYTWFVLVNMGLKIRRIGTIDKGETFRDISVRSILYSNQRHVLIIASLTLFFGLRER